MLVGKSSFRVVLPYSIFLFFIFAVLVFSSLPFGEKEVVAAEAAATKTTPVTKKFYDEKKFKEFQENLSKEDSDGDGLKDMEEVLIYNSDFQKNDSDNDGFNDGDEVKKGYNPNGSGKETEVVKTKRSYYETFLNIENMMYCEEYDYNFSLINQKIDETKYEEFSRENVINDIMKKLNLTEVEFENIMTSFYKDKNYDLEGLFLKRNFLGSEKYCADTKAIIWKQLEMTLDVRCSGYNTSVWEKITNKKKSGVFFIESDFDNISKDSIAKSCPDLEKNKKEISDKILKTGLYDFIYWMLPDKKDIAYIGDTENGSYLVHIKSNKIEKILHGGVAKLINGELAMTQRGDGREYFIYKGKKIFFPPILLTSLKNEVIEIDGEIVTYDLEIIDPKTKKVMEKKLYDTIVYKNGKIYKKVNSELTELKQYKDSFVAIANRDRMYLDKNNSYFFKGYLEINKFIVKDNLIYALATEKNGSNSILVFDGKKEKKLKTFPKNIMIKDIFLANKELAFAFFNKDEHDKNKKCSITKAADDNIYCLNFLNPGKFKQLVNKDIYLKPQIPSNEKQFIWDSKNTVFRTGKNSINLNGKEEKYPAKEAKIKDLGDDFGICYSENNKEVCIINGKKYSTQPNIHVDYVLHGKEFMRATFLSYKNKIIYTDYKINQSGNIKRTLIVDGKEVASCNEISIVYVDDISGDTIYYTCQDTQNTKLSIKKTTIK